MKLSRSLWIHCILFSQVLSSATLRAEAVDDRNSSISPRHTPGAGEFMHGQGYGKLMLRVLMIGAVPSQGIHYFPEGSDLMFALLYSGGTTDTTKLDEITIRRRGVKDLIEVDLESLFEDGRPIPRLADGDVVNVPFNWKKDFQTFLAITGVITSVSGFVLSVVALTKR